MAPDSHLRSQAEMEPMWSRDGVEMEPRWADLGNMSTGAKRLYSPEVPGGRSPFGGSDSSFGAAGPVVDLPRCRKRRWVTTRAGFEYPSRAFICVYAIFCSAPWSECF